MDQLNQFDPVTFSHEENTWLLEHLGEPTVIALRNLRDGVNRKQVKELLDRVQELEEIKKHEGLDWIGIDAIKAAIKTYLSTDSKWEQDHKRNPRAPRFPSLYSFDSKGRAHIGGPGSDSGRVRTYFDAKGNRVPFAINLTVDNIPDWAPPGFGDGGTEKVENGLVVNDTANRIECFCGHTEQFKASSRSSFAAARARISKHLRRATENTDQHRELYTAEFGGSD